MSLKTTRGLAASAASSFSDPVKDVLIVGGVHGNEYTGVWCLKSLQRQLAKLEENDATNDQDESTRWSFPNLQLHTLFANAPAVKANRRFLETDLNREFSWTKLQQYEQETPPTTLEGKRAVELHRRFGPKDNPKMDACIDLHTTTANMGVCLIFCPEDVVMAQAAAYVQQCWASRRTPPVTERPPVIMLEDEPDRIANSHLASIARHDMTIEVGPVPQGVLRHDIVQDTNLALRLVLEFLDQRSNNPDQRLEDWFVANKDYCVDCFMTPSPLPSGYTLGKISWPSASDNPNFPAYVVHESLQDRDFELPLRRGDPLFVDLDDNIITYDGAFGDEDIYPTFINEGGYYYASSGCGIGVTVKRKLCLRTAKVLPVNQPSQQQLEHQE